jgi:CubicO group peptidase (beta-lactamase class C family)
MFKKITILSSILLMLTVGLTMPTLMAQDDGHVSYWPTDGWRSSTPEEQGMDSDALADLMEDFAEDDGALDSLLVVRNGYVVLDAYIHPFEQGRRHELYSVTKSITSTVIGAAIQQGYIESVDQTVVELLGDLVPDGVDEEHAALTLEHMLMMGSGIDCPGDEGNQPTRGTSVHMEGDRYEDLLLEPIVAAPAERFQYCNPVSNLLSVIVTQTTGQNANAFATQHVFEPLGIRNPLWSSDSRGNSVGAAQLQMTPYDMAKIGYLYLNDGQWDGEQIIPADYVRAATSGHIYALGFVDYGYQWWVIDENVAVAWGYGGQHIIINRDLNIIIVTTATNALDFIPYYHNLMNRVFAALTEDTTENPESVERLDAVVSTLANPITINDDLLVSLDGQTFDLPDNDFMWESIRISTTVDPDVLLISINHSADVPMGMTSTGEIVNAADADWLPGNSDLMLSGEWTTADTLHISAQPFLPPGALHAWLTFNNDGVAEILTFGG